MCVILASSERFRLPRTPRTVVTQSGVATVERIPKAVLALPTSGVNLTPGAFGEQLSDQPTALVFLRHFG